MFRLDPVAVMDETDHFRHIARIAAMKLVAQWKREANQKSGTT